MISNVVLSLSLSSVLKLNKLKNVALKSLFNDISHYSDACIEPRLYFYVCFRLKYSDLFIG